MTEWTEFSCILKPSTISGIGVFAAHDIAKGAPVFTNKHPTRRMKISDVPPEFIKYCVYVSDDECIAPERFDRMTIGFYLNHSDTPNIKKISDTEAIAARDIKAGEELVMDYNQLNEPEHLKEEYYKV